MLSKSRNSKNSKASLCAPRPHRNHKDTSQYDLGTYVMAKWRNDFEYLAEVLAHRQRQGDRLEYRLRYIWDNVVEWTPASKLRKASQYEIDFVLQFCRQHGSSHSTRLTSGSNNLHSPKTECELSASPKNNRVLTTRSNVKQAEPIVAVSNNCNKSNNIPATKPPKNLTEPKLETSFEQNDMVYDKAVLQFHEACRKRRELKRQAALAANGMDSSVSTDSRVDSRSTTVPIPPPRPDSSKACVPISGSRKRKLSGDTNGCQSVDIHRSPRPTISSNNEVKSPPQAKRRHELQTPTSVLEQPASPHSTGPQRSGATDRVFDKLDAPSSLVLRISKQKCVPPKPRSPLVLTVSKPGVATSPPPKPEAPNGGAISSLGSSADSPDVAVAPIVHPCPYCPRRLRRAKLLHAHIANYHKAEADSETDRKPSLRCEPQSRPGQTVHGSDRRPTQQSQRPLSLDDDRLSSTDTNIPRHMLTCHRCGACNRVSDKETEALLQCQSCLCWVHRTCYCPRLEDGVVPVFTCCDGCLRTSERVRSSRRNECLLPWQMYISNYPDTGVNKSSHRLLADTTELLDWTHRLKPLLKTGWTLLNNTKPPSPTATKVPPCSVAATDIPKEKQSIQSSTFDGLSSFGTDRESPVKRLVDTPVPLESCGNGVTGSQATTEHADGFFMEFENTPSLERIIHFPAHSDSDALPVRPTTGRFPPSTVANSAEPGYWHAIDDDTGGVEDVSDSNDALTGFLRDLGPNVLPDLDGIVDYFTVSNVDPSCPRPTTLLNGQDDEDDLLSGVGQPHVASILDTPIKEALRAAHLFAPVPATILTSVLQTSDSESKSTAIYQHPTTTAATVLPIRSSQGHTDFPEDGARLDHRDAVNLIASSESVSGEQFSASSDLLTIVPFRDSLEEADAVRLAATAVPCPEQSPGDDTCYAPQMALSTSSDCTHHNLMGSLQVSEMDWISAPVVSVCTATSTLPPGNSSTGCASSAVVSVPGTVEPVTVVTAGEVAAEPTSDDVAHQFGFLPMEVRGRPAPTTRLEESQEEEEVDYLDHRWVLANHKVGQNLDHLDQFILGPLERAITVVEAQLEQISTQLFVEGGSSEDNCP